MPDTNVVAISGNLTADPQLKKVGDDLSVLNFSIANNGRKKEEVNFFDVVAWRGLADNIAAYKVKGDKVTITGYLQQQRYEKDGQKRSRVVLNATDVQFHNRGGDGNGQQSKNTPVADDDEIPF